MPRLFKYSRLLNLKVMHKYFAGLLSGDLHFEPTVETRHLMSKYGMVARHHEFGFEIYAETDDDGKLKKAISENLGLTFLATNRNPYFDNFTDLPIEKRARNILYFSNQVVNQVNVFGSGTQALLLNMGESVSGADYIRLVSSVYQHSLTAPGISKNFRLVRLVGDTLLDEKTIVPDNGRFFYRNDMVGYANGCYRLEIDGVEADRFYFQPDPAVSNAMAVVEIYTQVPAAMRFITGGDTISTKEYVIAFLNRSTKWRYLVTNRANITLPNPAIAIGNNTGLFTKTGLLTFVSNAAMPLQQSAVAGIRLLKDAGNLSSEAMGNLANAGIERVIPVEDNGSYTLYSDIFIYL